MIRLQSNCSCIDNCRSDSQKQMEGETVAELEQALRILCREA